MLESESIVYLMLVLESTEELVSDSELVRFESLVVELGVNNTILIFRVKDCQNFTKIFLF